MLGYKKQKKAFTIYELMGVQAIEISASWQKMNAGSGKQAARVAANKNK